MKESVSEVTILFGAEFDMLAMKGAAFVAVAHFVPRPSLTVLRCFSLSALCCGIKE